MDKSKQKPVFLPGRFQRWRREGGIHNRNEKTVVNPQDFHFRTCGQNFAENQARYRKHQAQFHSHPCQQQESLTCGYCPESMPAKMLDQSIENFIKPTHKLKRKTRSD